MRPVRCGGEAACLDRAMGWVLAPLRNADRADRWAGERARKLVAGPIWAGPVRAGATWRAGQSAETSFSSGGGGFSWAGLVLHHPRRLASFLRTLATGRTAPCPSRVRQPPAGRRAFAPSCLGSTACPGSMAREACGAFAAFPSKGGRQGQAAVSGSARHRAGREPVQHATPNEPPVAETLRDAAASRRRGRPKGRCKLPPPLPARPARQLRRRWLAAGSGARKGLRLSISLRPLPPRQFSERDLLPLC